MKGLADGRIEPSRSVLDHLDLCLDCRGCETACPSGVQYHALIEQTRQQLEDGGYRGQAVDRWLRMVVLNVLPYPFRMKLALLPVRMIQKLGGWQRLLTFLSGSGVGANGQSLSGGIGNTGDDQEEIGSASQRTIVEPSACPPWIEKMAHMLPPGRLWEKRLAPRYGSLAPNGRRKASVGWFTGCIGGVLFQDINRQAIALLQQAGYEVFVPRFQRCCGAIHQHNLDESTARKLAKNNLKAFLSTTGEPFDYVVNAVAGCGAMLKEYPRLLANDPEFSPKAQDLCPARLRRERTIGLPYTAEF